MTRPIVISGLELTAGRRILLIAPDVLDGDDLDSVSKGLKEAFPEVEFIILGGGFDAIVLDNPTFTGEIDG